MSQRAEYKFIPTDPEDIIVWLTDIYEEIMGVTIQPASPERQFIQWMAEAIVLERVMTNYTANQNIPSRAVGENLDALAELFYTQERPQAKAATCTMRFTISEPQAFAVLIPKGTRVTDARQTLVWETLADVYVNIGESCADTKVQCQKPGEQGNGYVKGQIDSIIDPFAYFLSCENLTESDGGADAATDEEFYELLRLSMDGYSCAGARGGYIYFAKQVSTEIADVIAASPTPGVVKLYVLMDDGTPATEEMKERVLAACSAEDVRPLTDLVSVEDPENVDYHVRFTFYTQEGAGVSGEALEAAVRDKVAQYTAWQCAKLGRDINPSRLISMLMETGIKRVAIEEPAFTSLKDGSGTDAPQLARLAGLPVIINGGYEDE
ncbi:MAG: phage baseplate protein [Oscillospiraceae bacterium]|nr:phage baseplate protein [Oscillospiraceae bacterium]